MVGDVDLVALQDVIGRVLDALDGGGDARWCWRGRVWWRTIIVVTGQVRGFDVDIVLGCVGVLTARDVLLWFVVAAGGQVGC